MAGKSYIKVGSSNWDRIKKMYIKTGGQTWTAVRKAYIKTSSGWKKVFDTTSNRPYIRNNDIPKIRLNTFRTDSTYNPTGTVDDPVNPVIEAPPVQKMGPDYTSPSYGWPNEAIGRHLWGYDGDWVSGNGSSMTFVYSWLYNLSGNQNNNILETGVTSSTGRADMLTNTSTHLGQNDGDYFDRNFLTFRVTATNSAGSASSESTQVYIVRDTPTGSITMIEPDIATPNTTMSATFSYSSSWYNKVDTAESYVEWFAVDNLGDALTTSNRVQSEYLNTFTVSGSTTKSGTTYHNPTLTNKYYYVRITLNNSNTLPAKYNGSIININGFTPNSAVTATANKNGKTASANGPFNLTNAAKTARFYDSASSTYKRYVSVDIGQSSSADRYEVQIEGQYSGALGSYDYTSPSWVVLQSLTSAPYIYESSRIGGTLTMPSVAVTNYLNYRFTARSRNGTSLSGAAYSNNGTSTLYQYVTAPAVAPSAPQISNIATSSDYFGVYVTFNNYVSSQGSNEWDYYLYSTDNGSNWTSTSGSSGYINNNEGKIYVTEGQTVNLRIKLTNLDGATSTQSNLLSITAAAFPSAPTSVVVKSFSGNQGTIFFTAGANTQSVQGYLEYDSFNQFDSITGSVNVSSGNAAKIQLTGANSTSRVYTSFLRAYSGVNLSGGSGSITSYTTKVLSGTDNMSVSIGAPTLSGNRTINYSWTLISGAPTHYIARLYRYSDGSTMSIKTLPSTTTSVSFTSSDGVDFSTMYYIGIQPQYQYTSSVTYEDGNFMSTNITTGANLSGATSTSIVSMERLTDSSIRATIGSSGASGPYYQLYWVQSTTAPTSANYDAAGTSSTVIEDYSFGAGLTYYFYIRSSNENLGNTTTNGTATAGTYSDYGPSTGAASYTFVAPNNTSASISGSTSVGSTLTLSTSAQGQPYPQATIIWRIANGGTGGSSFSGGTILQNGGTTLVIPSTAAGISTVGYAVRAEVTYNNGLGTSNNVTVNSNSIVVTSAGVAPSGGSVTLTPSGTQMAGTTLSANVAAMSGTATITYVTSIRKKTGSAPTSNTDGTEVASGTGTGNGVATHTITASEASGTPDQFRAFTTGTNTIGSNTVSSNTVISTPYVAPVTTPSGGTATSTPSTGTAGTTTYVGSTSGWSGSPTSYTYSWQYFSSSSFSWVQYTSGTNFSPPANVNTVYPNYGWQLSVGATNSAGTGYATTSITVNNPAAGVTVPGIPTSVSCTGSGSVSWGAPTSGGTPTSYEIEFYTASNGSGSGAAGPYSSTGISSSPSQLPSPYGGSGANWARVRVRARNSAGAGTYSDWYPSASTYV